MIWKQDIRKIQCLLDDTIGGLGKPPIPFLDWLHSQIMKSEFAEAKKVVAALADARRTIIYFQDEGVLPFGEFTPKDSPERDDFIIDKTLEYFKIKLGKKERSTLQKRIGRKLAIFPAPELSSEKHIKNTGRGELEWYYPTTWDGE